MTAEPTPRLSTVFFDFGDTLWHFPQRTPPAEVHRATGERFAALFEYWELQSRQPPEWISARLDAECTRAEIEADATHHRSPDYLAIVRETMAAAGVELSDEQVAKLWEADNVGGPFLGRRIFDDAHETLQWLLDSGFRVGAITNRSHGGTTFLDELRYHDLLKFFEVVSSSDQVGWRKPHRAIFDHALEAMGVGAEQSALVGDRPDADVSGARQAGMTAVWMRKVTPNLAPRGPEEQPHYTIDELSDLRSLPPFADGAAS